MKRSRRANSIELQQPEEFKNPRLDCDADQETNQASYTTKNDVYLQKDHAHGYILQEDHTQPLVGLSCKTSNKQSLKKTELGLDVNYYPCFLKASLARTIFHQLEEELLTSLNASQNEVIVMGKVHKIPRKQAAFGDPGLVYKFSGIHVSANPWIPILESLRNLLTSVLGERFNFVLVNRYEDGLDHIGEHRDDADDLSAMSSIAALSLGQKRDILFKHRDSRGSKGTRKDIDVVKVCLEHGSLLVMNFPTNVYWYHSLPIRKSVVATRISLTYRVLKK